jgi:hypothetical protein
MSATLTTSGICPKCEQDVGNEAKLRRMTVDNHRLREMLKDAWLLGSIHDKPTFEQLNQWRAMLNKKE